MANTRSPAAGSLILTLALDRRHEAMLDALRRAAWPGARPGVPAHLTLLRQLPGSSLPGIISELRMEARARPAFAIRLLAPRAHGDAVFVPARGAELLDLHASLVHRLEPLLRPQDRGPPDLHVTLAAGLKPAAAQTIAAGLGHAGIAGNARAEALLLWQIDLQMAEARGPPPVGATPWSLLVRLRLGR